MLHCKPVLSLAAAAAWTALALSPVAAQDAWDGGYDEEAYLWEVSEEDDDDPFAEYLFEPDFVLEHADRIGLSEQQRMSLIDEVVSIQADISRAELQAVSSMGRLHELLGEERIDIDAVMPIVDMLLEIETETKRRYLGLMIELHNGLTETQRDQLHALREDDAF